MEIEMGIVISGIGIRCCHKNGWEWEWGWFHGNGRKWERWKSFAHTSSVKPTLRDTTDWSTDVGAFIWPARTLNGMPTHDDGKVHTTMRPPPAGTADLTALIPSIRCHLLGIDRSIFGFLLLR